MENKIHIGIIPDGNRRYAKKYSLSLSEAYSIGMDNFMKLCDWVKNRNDIDEITVYALSEENLSRKRFELDILFKVFRRKIDEYLGEFNRDGNFYVKFYGNIPDFLIPSIKKLESKNSENYEIKVNVLLGYSGKQEIVEAIKKILKNNCKEIDKEKFKDFLYVGRDLDLIVRTGGYQRLSNFMLYQSAYAELYFIDKLWGEMDIEDFENALRWYKNQKRNFGR